MRDTASTIVIGLGNPVLTDDSVGLKAAARVKEQSRGAVATAQLQTGGIWLMEAMAGYARAVVIDAMVSGGRPGTIRRLGPADLGKTRNAHSTHDGSFAAALELGRMAGLELPGEIRIWAVEAGDVETFSEDLTPAVEHALPQVVDQVMRHLSVRRMP